MLKIAVLISGRGSNLQAILDACNRPDVKARVRLVIADRPAAGLKLARKAGINDVILGAENSNFERGARYLINNYGCDLICLAGFMRILSADFCQHYSKRIINIHPSLLPKYKGLNTHRRVLAAGEKTHGCTIHWVTPEVDGGEIIAQRQVAVLPDDDEATLAARVLAEEHRLYATTIIDMANRLASDDDKGYNKHGYKWYNDG